MQYDTNYVEGFDSSYKFAYFHRIYEMMKVRLIEGASNSYIGSELNTFYNNYVQDSINGNMLDAYKRLLKYNQLNNVLESELQYYHGEIEINEMCRRMINNPVYDNINMNTFNFVNAAFDNLLFRYPTEYEFDQVYTMIDDNTAQIVLGSSGNNKEDFTYIICDSREFYQGMIIWTYNTLLARNPTSVEVDLLMNDFYFSHDYQWLQRQIMKTDEYAHFNKYFLSFLIFIILFSSCKKDDPVYSINQIQANAYNANKTKLKSPSQFISILYANLFQKALSANELVEITRCIESVGDKELVHEVIISNFMNRDEVTLPSDSLMRADLEAFIEETYRRFYVRDITAAEREFFINFFNANPDVSAEMVYTAFSLSNEYQFY